MKLLLLASGDGSLAQALIDAKFDIAAIFSDISTAGVLSRAQRAGISTKVIEFRKPRSDWEREVFEYAKSIEPDLVVSVGFMRILSPEFVTNFKVINSHPSLLPNFPGAHAVRDALAARVQVTGCTVHWVDSGLDTGEIIKQRKIPVLPGDDESSLHERIKIVERELIVETVRNLGVER